MKVKHLKQLGFKSRAILSKKCRIFMIKRVLNQECAD